MSSLSFRLKQYGKMLLQGIIFPAVYRIFCTKPVTPHTVVFADAHSLHMPFDMQLLAKKFRTKNYQISEVFFDAKEQGTRAAFCGTLRFLRIFARVEYVVICDYFLPVTAVHKRPETRVVQLWHSCGAIKKFGKDTAVDIPSYYRMPVMRNYDLVPVSAPLNAEIFARSMGLPREIFQPIGVSRTDVYFSHTYLTQCRQEFFCRYPQALGKKIILWAPTFRGNAGTPELVGCEAIAKLQKQLPKNCYLVKSLHPHLKKAHGGCAIPTERLLPVADVLISDYSGVIFEFALLKKPIVLFLPDFAAYTKQRGLNIQPDALPGEPVYSADTLPHAVLRALAATDLQKTEQFCNTYLSACDGTATERIFLALTQGGQ